VFKMDIVNDQTKPYVRVLIMLLALLSAVLISSYFTGSPFPKDEKQALVFQNSLLLVVLGSAFLEHYFTKPADSMINSLMAVITLVGVYEVSPSTAWWLVFSYCFFVFSISAICVSTSQNKGSNGIGSVINSRFYRSAVVLGKARLIFSIVFLFGIYAFYSIQSTHTLALIVFWGVFLAIWPLRLPQMLSAISFSSTANKLPLGTLLRIDNPGVLRFSLEGDSNWNSDCPHIYKRLDGSLFWVLPLYSHYSDRSKVGTGILLGGAVSQQGGLITGKVYQSDEVLNEAQVMDLLGEKKDSRLVGFISEDSTIERVKFEVRKGSNCVDGMLVWCLIDDQRVFYQISAGITLEENLGGDNHGHQVALASQLGPLDDNGFHKYDWLPNMNTPVFSVLEGSVIHAIESDEKSNFEYGKIPNSELPVCGDFVNNLDHHTAVLGVTGSGKTELTFDMIRHSVSKGVKVICIDLTLQYEGRLTDLDPIDLSIPDKATAGLSDRLFSVETGAFKAGEEKKTLQEYRERLEDYISKKLSNFLEDKDDYLGLIQLQEISNSQASIYITEVYMTCLLSLAKEKYLTGEKENVVVVVEEAHTVMPEANNMGIQDFSSKGLISRISQLALQGRKYGIGLMILAQRTANVSKTVLTQCNSIISFACYDETSISFLKNMFGSTAAEKIPNLKRLQAMVFGKIVNSERPIVVEIPYDENKANK